MSMMDFLQHLDDRALYNMTGILDYDTNLRIVGGVLLICLLLRATVFESHLCTSAVGGLQTVIPCTRVDNEV